MDDKQIQKMFDDTYEDSKTDTLRSMLKEFYNRRMLTIVVIVWVSAVVLIVAMVLCGMRFFATESVKSQIMYAAVFVCLFTWLADMKIFAWLMMHRNSIKREIKRLELRVAEYGSSAKEA
jgi:uncharacterized membrane protein